MVPFHVNRRSFGTALVPGIARHRVPTDRRRTVRPSTGSRARTTLQGEEASGGDPGGELRRSRESGVLRAVRRAWVARCSAAHPAACHSPTTQRACPLNRWAGAMIHVKRSATKWRHSVLGTRHPAFGIRHSAFGLRRPVGGRCLGAYPAPRSSSVGNRSHRWVPCETLRSRVDDKASPVGADDGRQVHRSSAADVHGRYGS